MAPSPDDLMQAYFDGTISAEEEQELRRWIEADDANLDEFVRQVEVHATLWEEQVPVGEVEAETPAPASRRIVRASRFQRSRAGNPALVSLVAAVGLLAFVGIVMSAFWGQGDRHVPPVATSRPRSETPPPSVAKAEKPPVPVPAPVKSRPEPRPLTEARPLLPTPGRRDLPKPSTLPPSKSNPVVEKPPAPPEPKPVPPPKPPAPATIAAVATLEVVDGAVHLIDGEARNLARTGSAVLPGNGIEVGGRGSRAVLKYADGSRFEIGSQTIVRSFTQSKGKGKRILLERGRLDAQVSKQPAGKSMVFTTPHGTATVLGTTLRLTVELDRNPATRLDVKEGRVRLTRKADGRSVLVTSGHFAVADASGAMAVRSIRAAENLLALYEFKERRGSIVHDTSRRGAPLNLQIRNASAVRWMENGLEIRKPTILESAVPAEKIFTACQDSRELTVEIWVTPNLKDLQPSREPARFVTFSKDAFDRNFTLEQRAPVAATGLEMRDVLQIRYRRGATVTTPELDLRERLMHIVATRHANNRLGILYVDGIKHVQAPGTPAFTNWNAAFRLALAGEFGDAGSRAWLGTLHRVAIYGRALGSEEVEDHHFAGPR